MPLVVAFELGLEVGESVEGYSLGDLPYTKMKVQARLVLKCSWRLDLR